MSEPTTEPAAETQQPAVDPTEWVGREVDYDGHKWTVAAADFATSGLPRRDGKPGRLQYHRVLELALERDGIAGEPEVISEAAYLCIFCNLVKSSARGVAVHQKHEHADLVPESDKPSRVHFSADFREMTVEDLREMHRSYQGMADKFKEAAAQVAEANRLRKEAEKGLATIRRILGPAAVPAETPQN